MSEIAKKYNVPEEAISKMMKDGVISCTWKNFDEVSRMYKEGKSTNEIADITHQSPRNVRYIINMMK